MDWESFFTHYRKPGFIPGYEIVNKLGSGVFGEVYKARKESIGKFYAIKFLKVSDEKISEAIFKELEALRYFAQIDHPHLVSIEDQGEVMGIPYIVMGYAGDDTLKKRLQGGPLSPEEAGDILRQVCSGVAALHEKSIIHFDLKPANIFMKGSHARVGDYGLSKLVSESHMTMSIGRGTPYYMAPEMLTRKGDHRSDIYSLGTIVFEMLTGDVPFKGDSEWEVLKKHETQDVVLPPDMPEPFRSIVIRCMAKKPEDRFQSMAEIQALLDGNAAAAGPAAPKVAPRGRATPPGRPIVPPPLPPHLGKAQGLSRLARSAGRGLAPVVRKVRGAGQALADLGRKQGKGMDGDRPLDDSFYTDFESEGDEVSRKKRRPFFLFRPIFAAIHVLACGLKVFFTNFFRYALVIAITAGLALLIDLALRGQLAG